MTKMHLKRLAVPLTWGIMRKTSRFVTRPRGYLKSAMPVAVILKELLHFCSTRDEIKKIMRDGKVSIDGKVVKDDKLPVGLMAVISVKDSGTFRMLLNRNGRMFLKKIDSGETGIKPCKIISKKTLKKSMLQLGFHDGRTSISEIKTSGINDTLIFSMPDFKVQKHLRLEKGAFVYLTGGSNAGSTGIVENVSGSITVKIGESVVKASKENVFVIGKDTIDVSEK